MHYCDIYLKILKYKFSVAFFFKKLVCITLPLSGQFCASLSSVLHPSGQFCNPLRSVLCPSQVCALSGCLVCLVLALALSAVLQKKCCLFLEAHHCCLISQSAASLCLMEGLVLQKTLVGCDHLITNLFSLLHKCNS